MRAYLLGGLIVVGLALAAGKTAAHHPFAAEFDRNKPITLAGTVTKVEWTNPHVWFYVNLKDETGKVNNWGVEMGPAAWSAAQRLAPRNVENRSGSHRQRLAGEERQQPCEREPGDDEEHRCPPW